MFCQNCGTQLNAGQRFCSGCGTQQAPSAQQIPQSPPQQGYGQPQQPGFYMGASGMGAQANKRLLSIILKVVGILSIIFSAFGTIPVAIYELATLPSATRVDINRPDTWTTPSNLAARNAAIDQVAMLVALSILFIIVGIVLIIVSRNIAKDIRTRNMYQ